MVVKLIESANMLEMEETPLDPESLDLGYLALFLGMAVNRTVIEALTKDGWPALRNAHGFLVQYLLTGPKSVGELAKLAGVSQQAISKSLRELAQAGHVVDVPSDDGRVRRVALSKQARALLEAGRAERAKLHGRLQRAIGRDMRPARRALLRALEELDALDAIRERRVRPLT